MPRRARVVFEGVVHHITQRGNYRQNVFEDDSDKRKYVEFIREYSEKYGMKIYAYCLMSNHVHFIAAPVKEDSLAMTFKYSNMRVWFIILLREAITGRMSLKMIPIRESMSSS